MHRLARLILFSFFSAIPIAAQSQATPLEQLKRTVQQDVRGRSRLAQQIVDQLYSFGELGFQETETSKYLVGILRANGFTVTEGIAGIPTSWVATWGSGHPVISLGSDLDGIPQASQFPGVACHLPIIAGAPGHGEGHNSGQAVNIVAALAAKQVMEKQHLRGTLQLWPGVAEEQLATKAYLVRAGIFRDVDAVLFSHVNDGFGTTWGDMYGSGLVSVLYSFAGQAAHAGGTPWLGRSALDAVELMDVGWNFRREHLPLTQRSHSVIRDGGDQPNVVPPSASTWYFLRELDYPSIKQLWAVADSIAEGAAMMTGTTLLPTRVLGSAWPRHFNRPLAEALNANIQSIGMPAWDDADQSMARAVQKLLGRDQSGLATTPDSIAGPVPRERNLGGPSDDVGDVAWSVPTAILLYPSNIPGVTYHHWSASIAMATPIAHKGAVVGAEAMASTIIDLLLKPELVEAAKKYFEEVQTKEIKYQPLIRPGDTPATELNQGILAKYRPGMKRFYYNPAKYKTYLDQLGVKYPTLACPDSSQ